jgi:hypothetical protein
VHGHTLPIRLPWIVSQRIPVLENVLPTRLAAFTLFALALLLAVFLDRVHLPRYALAAIVAVAFVPLIPDLPFLSQPNAPPRFFETGATQLPDSSVALVAPQAGLAGGAKPMLWQVAAGLRFKMPGAYAMSGTVSRLPLKRRINDIASDERPPPPTPQQLQRFRCDLIRLDARTVIVGPTVDRERMVALFRAVLARPPEDVGGVQLWRDALASARAHARSCA